MGCGRVGARLAGELAQEGHRVSVIDVEAAAFLRLPEGFTGKTVLGTGVDKDVQREAGIEDAALFLALAHGDNRNAMAAQVAKRLFGVERVVARIYDPERAAIYEVLGVTAVSPTTVLTDLLHREIVGR